MKNKPQISADLKEHVVKEACALRKHATHEELQKLDFGFLIANSSAHCIYGQMTGFCRNLRALELLSKCSVPYSEFIGPFAKPQKNEYDHGLMGFSPIEHYIAQDGAQNKKLIEFLKGKRETLTGDDL